MPRHVHFHNPHHTRIHLPTTLLIIPISVVLTTTTTPIHSPFPHNNLSIFRTSTPSPSRSINIFQQENGDVDQHESAGSDSNLLLLPPIVPPVSLPLRSRGQSTIKIGAGGRADKNMTNPRSRGGRPRPPATPTDGDGSGTDSSISQVPVRRNGSVVDKDLYAGLILPFSIFHNRDYLRFVNQAMNSLKQKPDFADLIARHFSKKAEDHLLIRMITFSPSPKDILSTLCDVFLASNVSAIIYLTNTEMYGASTAASQYFLQLSGYLGLPVIAWNADNSGLRRRATSSNMDYNTEMVLQLAPSIHHQAAAMLSILIRYNWHQFAIVTSQIAGHDDFVQAVRDRVLEESQFKFTVLSTVLVLHEEDLLPLVGSEARILLLYCTKDEAKWIMREATRLGLTGSKYVWVVTQSVMGDKLTDIHYQDLPIGMLGVHFNTTIEALKYEITNAVKVFMTGVQAFRNDTKNNRISLTPNLSCDGSGDKAKWNNGDHFYRALTSVKVESDGSRPHLTFNNNGDGTLSKVELQIMNLRPISGMNERTLVWEQIGTWRSWRKADEDTQLDIKDIVWPGKSHKPPDGVPEKFHLKITFLEEAPYIRMTYPDPVTGKCSPDRGVLCRIRNNNSAASSSSSSSDQQGASSSSTSSSSTRAQNSNSSLLREAMMNSNMTLLSNYQCCSGFNIDLLIKFAEDIGFTYELVRVPDSKWGAYTEHKWNGLIGELTNRRVDVALASLMINSEREAVVDFSVPFMDSGIAIMTSKRTGIISPTAFLEPFDASLWFLVCVVGIQVYSLFIFFFEWLSPLGFDMKKYPTPGSRFSFFRSCWLVWARLFQASVHVDPPRGFTAKFVVHVWSMFAVVFLATYTANLAVFMITREESHQFVGVHDNRLTNPMSVKPPLKFGTVVNTHTAGLFKKYHDDMWEHMKQYNVLNVSEGVYKLRTQELDAFIYDGPVLQYEVLQDTSDNCQLLMEGAWYAHTGYGIAFQRNSKHLPQFNKYLMEYKENGDLDRLRRFYFTGPCAAERSTMQTQPTSIGKFNTFGTGPLALEQFLSVFLLLGIGVLVATAFVFCERAYANCIVRRVFGISTGGKDDFKKKKKNQDSSGSSSDGGGNTSSTGNVNKKPPPACLQLLSQNMGLPYSRTFYRAHKRDSKIKLLDHITSSFNLYDSNPNNVISDYHHGFLESFVLRKMVTCNDPICQRNFVKLESELKKCLVRLRQIENWGRMYQLGEIGRGTVRIGGGTGFLRDSSGIHRATVASGGGSGGVGQGILIPPRTRISTIERNRDEIVGRRICGDYSDYSIFSGVGMSGGVGGMSVSIGVGSGSGAETQVIHQRRVFRDEVIGSGPRSFGGSRRDLDVLSCGGGGGSGSGSKKVSVSSECDLVDQQASEGVCEEGQEGSGMMKRAGKGRGGDQQEVMVNQIIKVAEIETVL